MALIQVYDNSIWTQEVLVVMLIIWREDKMLQKRRIIEISRL